MTVRKREKWSITSRDLRECRREEREEREKEEEERRHGTVLMLLQRRREKWWVFGEREKRKWEE